MSRHATFLAAIAALLFALTLTAAPARAQVTISAGDASGLPGASVSLPLDAAGGFAAVQWDILFPPAALGFQSLQWNAVGSLHAIDSALIAPGHLRIVAYPVACPVGDLPAPGLSGQLRLRIAADAAPGEHPVDVQVAQAVAADASVLPIAGLNGGTVTVLGGPAATAPVFIPGPDGRALALLAVLLAVIAVIVLRRRAGTAFLVALLIISTNPPVSQAAEQGDAPPPTAIIDALLGRAGAPAGADCNGDGILSVADAVCAQQVLCAQPGNQPPSIAPIGNATIQAGDAWSHQASASDPDGDTLTWSLPQAPGGMQVSASGLLTWTPDATQLGDHDVQVRVTDPDDLSASTTFRLSVAEVVVNQPPSIMPLADRLLRVGQTLGVAAQASDPDPGDVLRFSISGAPAGLSLDAAAGRVLWVPSENQVGVHPLTLSVTDQGGLSDSTGFLVTVVKLGGPPLLQALPDQSLMPGQLLDITAQASDPDLPDDELHFSLPLAPTGMQIVAGSGRISWTPTPEQIGPHDVTVRVSDRNGLADFTSFIATVRAPNQPPLARDDGYAVRFGQTLDVPAPGLLDNDEDADGDALSVRLIDPPQRGTLTLNADGAFDYLAGSTGNSVQPNIDLTALLLPQTQASSTYSGAYPSSRLVDGNLGTSWFSARPHGEEWVDILFPSDVTVRSIELYGNRQSASITHAVTAGVLELYDDADLLRFASEELYLTDPEPARDLTFDVAAAAGGPVTDVRRIRLRITGYGSASDVGLAEIRVFGDGVAQALDAVEEWAWTEAGTEVTPSVIDLDGDGFPEIIFTASPDLLLVVDGRDGSERFRRNDAFWYETSPVVGDIDGDGMPEIVYMESNANFVMALEHDGTEKWRTNIGASIGNMALADLDGDGMPEIIGGHGGSNSGITVLNADGSARWTATSGGCGNHYRYCIPLVADVDLDGRPEIIGGNTLHDRDGSVLWSLGSLGDGFNAIGNFDDDPYAEIVLVRSGNVYLLEHDGTIKWGPVALPGGGRGGPPTVADFDGDGRPEIGVAGSSRYAVFDTDGSILWQMPVVDSSSNATGSTVFDFQNDGSAEVVYRDERTLWVFRGADGRVLFSTPIGSSTTAEAPIIADVDGDGQAEIVVSSDNQSQPLPDGSRRQPGLYVFGSSSGDWVAARKIWNQHSYHVTNILADGTIPAVEQPNWLTPGLNHYRQNAFLPGEIDQSDRFTYVANDGQDDSVPATVYLTLRPANAAPEIHSQPDTLAAVGVPYFHAVRALDPDPGDTLTFSLVTAPSGMSIDPATGLIRFTADSAQLGGHPVDVLVRDPLGFSAQQHYVLNVVDAVQVPDVVGQPQGDAESALSSAGFAPGQVALARHPSIPPGAVSAQSPAGGSHAVPGVPVNLTVSTGTGPEDDDNDGDGFTPNQGDCNDNDAGIHPGAPDPEGDGIDQDCDGVDGDEPITALFVQPDSATLLVGEALQLSAFVRFTDGSAQPVSGAANWTATAGAVIDGNGRLIATAPGPVQASASFQGHGGNAQISVIARDAGDNAAPLAEITAPAEGAQLLGPVDILGSASDPNLVRYELLLAPAGSADFRRIGGGVTAVSDGLLGRLDPTTLLNGLYRLRLTVLDAGGNLSFDETLVQIDGMQKVGHFSLAFSDLRLPLSGMPISVERAYDSRDKRQGDFGIGWQLGLASARAYCTRPLGEGWQVVRSGMSYLLYPTAPHRCSIDIPGRNLENFDFTPTPASSPIVPFSLLSGSFRAAPGTLGRLQAIGGINLAIVDAQPGEVSLLDDTTLNLFAPRNLRYTTRDGVRMEFRDGKLTRIEDRNANVLTISAAGIQHSSGKQVQFQRDAQGRIIRLIDPSGAEQAYAYSAAGDLATHTDALGNVTRFHYDADHYLVRIVDPLGRPLARTIYDDDGRVIAFTDGEGGVTSIVRDLAARSETRTLPDGSTTFSRWDERGNLLEHIEANGVRTRYGYNALDQVSTITNALGATQQFDYDDQGRMTRIEHDNGAVYTITPNAFGKVDQVVSPLGAITRYTYDTRGNLISSTDPDGHVRHFAHDARGNRVLRQGPDGAVETAEFDADGLPTAIIDALGHRTEYGYDANGRPQTVSIQVSTADGPRTLTRTDAYDAAGRRIASTDPAGQQTQLELDFAGQTQAVINPLGTRIEQDRDARGDLLAVRYGDGSEQRLERDGAGHIQRHVGRDGQARAMQYGPGGVLTSVLWEDATPGDPDDNMRLSFSTNALGDLSAIVTPEGQALVLEHDAEGRLIARTEQGRRISHEYDALGRKSADIDAAGRRTEYQYDAFDRIVRTTHADGSFTTADYDPNGRLVRRSDESGRDTHFEYDLAGRLLAVLDALGNETRYGWNEAGQRISQTDANGHTTAFEYNAAGRLAAIIRPDGARTAFDYDAAGNLLRRTDADGRDIVYAYDANHRLASRTLDGHTHAIVHDREGRRLSAEDGRGSVSYAYDETGRLTERIEPDGNFLRYRHDRAGRVVELQTPSGSVGYSWDADGRLAQVTDRDGETWTYQYDVLGRVERIVNARLTEQRQYDLRDRITRISHFDAGNVERLRFDYVYDAAGRVLSVTALDGSQASFQYDAAGRLVGESRSGAFPDNIALTLDAVGNRLSMAATGGTMHYGYDSNDRLIEETGPGGTTLFGYDASGRLLTESGPRNVGYVWSADDRLIGVSAEGVPTLNRDYDFDGLLVAQHSGGQSIGYLNDHSGSFARIVEEYVQGGTERTPILFGQGPLAQGSGAQKRHYALDRHSGVRALFGTGGPVSVLAYDAWGVPLAALGDSRLGYRGERQGGPLDHVYLRARHYDPQRGRFLSVDPHGGLIEQPVTLNPYLYGNADPVNHLDPSGELAFLAPVVGTFAGLGVLGSVAVIAAIGAVQGTVGMAASDILAFHSDQSGDAIQWEVDVVGGALSAGGTGTVLAYIASTKCVNGENSGQIRDAQYLSVMLGIDVGINAGLTLMEDAPFKTPRRPGAVGFAQSDFVGWAGTIQTANIGLGIAGANFGSYLFSHNAVATTPFLPVPGISVLEPNSLGASFGAFALGRTWGMGNGKAYHAGTCVD